MIINNLNANLVLSISWLLHSVQELFCEDTEKRQLAITKFRKHEKTIVKAFAYILSQAEKFHQFKLMKGGSSNGNSNTFQVETKKRVIG